MGEEKAEKTNPHEKKYATMFALSDYYNYGSGHLNEYCLATDLFLDGHHGPKRITQGYYSIVCGRKSTNPSVLPKGIIYVHRVFLYSI